MVDFACKKITKEEILKCSLGLTNSQIILLNFLIKNDEVFVSTNDLSKKLNLDLSTIQRAVKKLNEKKILIKSQKNLEHGGYIYEYKIIPKGEIKQIIMNIIKNWIKNVESEICTL